MWKYVLSASGLCLMLACQPVQSGGHSHDTVGGHSHEEEGGDHVHAEDLAISFTKWSEQLELFVEFKPLVVGEISRFAAHFTHRSDFKPVREGSLTVSLITGNKGIRQTVDAPSSPGIFTPGLQPTSAGTGRLVFEVKTPSFADRIVLPNITVYNTLAEAEADLMEENVSGETVSFLKEQAWRIDFAMAPATRQPIREVIRTSGEILPVRSAEKTAVAKTSGLVFFQNTTLRAGKEVRAGQPLFTVTSEGLVQGNLQEKYKVAQARLERARASFERAGKLLDQEIIGQKEFEQRSMEFTVARAELETLNKVVNAETGGHSVTAPISGIIKNILINDGQYVDEGTPLVEVTSNRTLILEAQVSQQYLPRLSEVNSAHFKAPYQEQVQSIEDYNGRLVQYGKAIPAGSHFIPVQFEVDNLGRLLPGSYVDMFLLTEPVDQAIVIPESALLQDYDQQYVYVQAGGETFEKRPLTLGISDGVHIQVLDGLSEGEWVVTKGAYQIKMASMSTTIPGHGHEH